MRVPWQCQVIISCTLLQYAEACFDSDGSFYCATLWYFWFTVFWIFMFIFIGVMCICNHVNKKKAKVDVQYTLPPRHRTPRTAEEGKTDSELTPSSPPVPTEQPDSNTTATSESSA